MMVRKIASTFVTVSLVLSSNTIAQSLMVNGEVKKIDESAGKITLKHGPIKSLGMDEGMTMVFRVKDPAMLKAVKEGEKKSDADHREGLHRSVVYTFNYEGINIAHLGGLGFVPAQSQVDALDTVHVLLIPIGGEQGLNAVQASELISMIEPSIVVPMNYEGNGDNLTKFLKEMGLSTAKSQDVLKVTKSSLPEDTQVMLLEVKE